MNEAEYASICAFVQKHSGIVLGESKAYLIESRLAPIADHFGFADVGTIARGLVTAPPDVRKAVIDAMTTNESFFFRDNTPFVAFEKTILPKLVEARRGGRIRIWCAAASTGQEPYSLAMILLQNKRLWSGINIEILGTDLSTSALGRARDGKYTQFEVQRGLPIQMLMDHFKQEGTNWIISDEVKNMVKLREMNLLEPMQQLGQMDIIFCRNVLIYFDVETKKKVLENMHKLLKADGFLSLGAAETMMGVTDAFERVDGVRGVYQPAQSQEKRLTA